MDTTDHLKHPAPERKTPLLNRVLNRFREARDEYYEVLEAGRSHAAAQTQRRELVGGTDSHRRKGESRGLQDAEGSTVDCVRKAKDGTSEQKEKGHHQRRHRSREKAHEGPDHRGRRKHTKPHARNRPHRKHHDPALQDGMGTAHLVERLVHRVEKSSGDKSVQVECLQDAAQRLLRIAEERGRSGSATNSSTTAVAEGLAGAEALLEGVISSERRSGRRGDDGRTEEDVGAHPPGSEAEERERRGYSPLSVGSEEEE